LNIVPQLTSKCGREDCRVSPVSSFKTCVHWTQTYDKQGRSLGHDPNVTTSEFVCQACGKRWITRTQDGKEPEINELIPAGCLEGDMGDAA
jgi:hypothetical protein